MSGNAAGSLAAFALLATLATGCTDEVEEKRCGDPSTRFSAHTYEELELYAECTTLVGHFQQDSVAELHDLAPLAKLRKFEGMMNLFRSPGLVTLHGLENLEIVEGDLFIHLNWNLTSIEALAKLRKVTGRLFVTGNDRLAKQQLDWLGGRVTVGGEKRLETVP